MEPGRSSRGTAKDHGNVPSFPGQLFGLQQGPHPASILGWEPVRANHRHLCSEKEKSHIGSLLGLLSTSPDQSSVSLIPYTKRNTF